MAAAAEEEAAGAPQERELTFVNAQGERLVGWLLDAGSKEVVILAHGYIANATHCRFPALARALAEAGISSYRFDHAMAIKSRSERRGPFRMGNHEEEVADYVAAAAALRTLGREVLCLLGHSKGGINVLLYASRYDDIPLIVDLSGRFKVRDGVLQRFGSDIFERLAREGAVPCNQGGFQWTLTEQDCRARADLDMEAAARSVSPSVRVLVLHGRQDTTIPYQESELATSLIPNARLALIDGDHNYTKPADGAAMIAEVVKFVTEQQ